VVLQPARHTYGEKAILYVYKTKISCLLSVDYSYNPTIFTSQQKGTVSQVLEMELEYQNVSTIQTLGYFIYCLVTFIHVKLIARNLFTMYVQHSYFYFICANLIESIVHFTILQQDTFTKHYFSLLVSGEHQSQSNRIKKGRTQCPPKWHIPWKEL